MAELNKLGRNELLRWVWISDKQSVRPSTKIRLFRESGGIEEIFNADKKTLSALNIGSKKEIDFLLDKSLERAERILTICEEKGIRLLNYSEEDYPNELKRAYDPPLTLYLRGEKIDFNSMFMLTIAGTRSASNYGLALAEGLGRSAALSGMVLVSGLGRGIDESSAKSCIACGGICIGVLGTAIDSNDSKGLYDKIIQKGLVVSEYAPLSRTLPANFRARNRILAGLSSALCIVEAPEKSGALLLADEAISQGKEVFVCPSNFGSKSGEGSNALLKDGANLLSSFSDIIEEYKELYPNQLKSIEAEISLTKNSDYRGVVSEKTAKKEHSCDKSVDKAGGGAYIELREQLKKLPELQLKIVSALGNESVHIDDISDRLGIPVYKITAELTLMQIKGLVKRENSNRYKLNVVYK